MNRELIKSNLEIFETLLENVLIMFKNRGYISNIKELYKKHKPTSITMNNFNIKSDIDNKMYHVFIHNVNINSIKKNSDVDDFLSKNVNNVKILLVPNVNKKILTQVLTKYPNSEVFRFSEMLENITEKIFIPKHTLMDEKSKEELLKLFKLTNLPKMSLLEPMARYYGAKTNDVFKIERNSVLSGKSIYYRYVTYKTDDIDIFF
jgi:DNA-directed RNA polymerase subunit H (RpoH/RPB5)